jgi:TatD DNase family protein
MYLIDTHCHLDLLENLETSVNEAKNAGVKQFVVPSTNADSALGILDIAQNYPEIYAAAGIYPTDKAAERIDENIEQLKEIITANRKSVVAIGECGLDFCSITTQGKTLQKELFNRQLNLAKKFNLPLIIHNRKANQEVLDLLSTDSYYGVLHCFSGSKQFTKEALRLNFYIGIGGLLTLDTGLCEVVKTIPLEKIVLETDTPYLTPKPIKDKQPWPNKPQNIVYTAQKLAEIKRVDIEEVVQTTTQNAKSLFKI